MTGLLTEPTTGPVTGAATGPMTELLRLVEPMPGFDDHLEFTLTDIDPDGLLLALRSVDDPALRFVLTPAATFFDGYEPTFDDTVHTALGAQPGSPLTVLLLLTIGDDLADATANLRAPFVLAEGGSLAMQVVLDDDSLSMRAPILPLAPPD